MTDFTLSTARNSITACCLNRTSEGVPIIDYVKNKIIKIHYRVFAHAKLIILVVKYFKNNNLIENLKIVIK